MLRLPLNLLFIGVIAFIGADSAEAKVVLFPWQVAPSQPPVPRPGESSNKPKTESESSQTQSNNHISAQNDSGSNENQNHRNQKPLPDWWFNGGLILVGLLQLWVFGQQARRLRQSIDLTRGIASRQERDMRASISEAAHAARAMDNVASGIAESVENTRTVLATQRDFAQRQMRAYVFVQSANIYTNSGFIYRTTPKTRCRSGVKLHQIGPDECLFS